MSSTEAFKSFRCEAEVLLKGIKEKHLVTINQVERVLVFFHFISNAHSWNNC